MKLSKLSKILLLGLVVILISIPVRADLSSDAKVQYNKGIDYYNTGMYSQAVECFKKATDLDPNYIDAYFNLGSLYEYLKQEDDALNAFKQIILRKPDDYESVYKAAELSFKTGNIEKASMYLTLIPKDTLWGQKAKQLADKMQIDIPTVKSEHNPSKSFEQVNPLNSSNGIYSDILSPTGIVTDNEGNLYVASFSDNAVYKISSNNNKIVYIKDNKIDGPIGLERDNAGNIYLANYNKNNVLKIDKSGKITEIISNIPNPYCMHVTGDLLFVSSQGNNTVVRYKLNQ